MKTPVRLLLIIGLVASVIAVVGFATTQQSRRKNPMPEKEFINPEGLSSTPSYTQVVTARGGKTIFVSGQVATNARGEIVGAGDLRAQTKQALENLRIALAASGATFADVVKMTYYIVNHKSEYLPMIRETRAQYLTGPKPPASTLIGVQALARDEYLIEIEAIAVVP
jgi:enamine deaminase RidA (YjgF/YER057c/UK114 family)